MVDEKICQIQKIPVELKSMIFSYLKLPSLQMSRLVCHDWCAIINSHNVLFSTTMTNRTGTSIINSKVPIDHLNVINTTQFPGMRSTISRSILPKISALSLDIGNSEDTIFRLFKITTFKHLTIRNESLTRVSIFGFSRLLHEINWNSLTHLSLDFEQPRIKHTKHMTQLLKLLTVPSLRFVTFFGIHFTCVNHQPSVRINNFRDMFVEFLGFLYRHIKSLIGLALNVFSIDNFPIDARASQWMEMLSSSMNLLDFSIGMSGDQNWPLIGLSCIQNADRLIKLRFVLTDEIMAANIQLEIENVIEKNSTTLEDINIGLATLNVRCLRNCKILKSLRVCVINLNTDIGYGLSRFNLPNLSHFEVAQSCFNYSVARLVAFNMKSLKSFHIIDWIGDRDENNIPLLTLTQLLISPTLVEIGFEWGINLDTEFQKIVSRVPGLKWANRMFGQYCLAIDRTVFDVNVIQNLTPLTVLGLID